MLRVLIDAAEHPPTDLISDLREFPQRDDVIRHLVGCCGWPRSKVGPIFGLSRRRIDWIASESLLQSARGITDLENYPARDDVIRHLVVRCDWPRDAVARIFEISARQFQRIVNETALVDSALHSRDQLLKRARVSKSQLTPRQIEAMVHDYARDPHLTPDEREAAWMYIEQGCPPMLR